MKLRWAALIAVLALSVLGPGRLAAQSASEQPVRDEPLIDLGPNYPNPFNIDTRIPFSVGGPPDCQDHGRLYRVSLRIYNILSQLVAIPVLQGGSGTVADGQPLENVLLSCDRYVAYWDGKYLSTQRNVASGTYIYRLEVDGKPFVKKMFVTK